MDSEKQKDEIIALESIFNKEEFSYNEENNCYQCTFKIFLTLPTGYYLTYKDVRNPEEAEQKIEISHVPPLSLYVSLPRDYPSTSSPKFTLCSSWLYQSSLAKLCKKLDKLWEVNENQEVLFVWVAFLQDETLKFLKIEERLKLDYAYTRYKKAMEKAQNAQSKKMDDINKETTGESTKHNVQRRVKGKVRYPRRKHLAEKYYDARAVSDIPMSKNPIQALIDYNEMRNEIEFKKNFYTCKICFADKSGEHCTRFMPCTHVFCKDCISGYLEVRIKEGTVQNICCPEEKCTSEANPAQIKGLISSELFAKYDSVLLNATLDTMSDIVYCPRRHCQYPVSREPNDQMANCPACQYAFCIYCKMVYHGIEPCKVNSAEKQKLVAEYQAASSEKKLEMEQRYGKKNLQVLVENTMSENWIHDNSQKCPHCNAAIEKSDGCNKMTCWHCNTFFCWICRAILNRDLPYLHYQNPESKCFNMLYHGLIPDEDDDRFDVAFGDDDDDDNFIQLIYPDSESDDDSYDELGTNFW